MTMTKKKTKNDRLTRRETAQILKLHPDTLSRLLCDGLGYAVVQWGGRGKLMYFDRELALRWDRAWNCTRGGPPYWRSCDKCSAMLKASAALAAHMIETRHGHGKCPKCTPPRNVRPCRRSVQMSREMGR